MTTGMQNHQFDFVGGHQGEQNTPAYVTFCNKMYPGWSREETGIRQSCFNGAASSETQYNSTLKMYELFKNPSSTTDAFKSGFWFNNVCTK